MLVSLIFWAIKVGCFFVVRGNLTQLSDGSFGLLNLLIRQADRTIGLLAHNVSSIVNYASFSIKTKPF